MLNRTAVIAELTKAVDLLYPRTQDVVSALHPVWHALMRDAAIARKFQQAHTAYHDITSWNVQTVSVQSYQPLIQYTVVAVDGSQIYPDRHQGINCFLLNISRIIIPYGTSDGDVLLTSEPSLHVQSTEPTMQMHTEQVNAVRAVREFEVLCHATAGLPDDQSSAECVIALLDGPLGLWQIGNGSNAQKELLERYFVVCRQLHEQVVLHAGYTSVPRATDIVRCLRRFCSFTEPKIPLPEQHCVDVDLLETLLSPGQATRWFASAVPGCDHYPSYAHPYFCYVHVGAEIARVEVPAWIAADQEHSAQILQGILSQADKGRGYPIALAEAHEQAVIKGPDRDFFYQALHRMTKGTGVRPPASQKLLRKRYL